MQTGVLRPGSKLSYDPEVQYFVRMYNICKQLSCLPHSGGFLDQDAYMATGLVAVAEAVAVREAQEASAMESKYKGRV